MAARTGTAHVVTTTRKYKDQVYRTHLLRRSYREDGVVKNETLGNLSHLPDALIDIIRRSLKGETFVPLGEAFEAVSSRPHGHVLAVDETMKRLDFAALLGSKSSRERPVRNCMHSQTDRSAADAAARESALGLPWLVADVGGTNARFGWVAQADGAVQHVRKLPTAAHAGPAQAHSHGSAAGSPPSGASPSSGKTRRGSAASRSVPQLYIDLVLPPHTRPRSDVS